MYDSHVHVWNELYTSRLDLRVSIHVHMTAPEVNAFVTTLRAPP